MRKLIAAFVVVGLVAMIVVILANERSADNAESEVIVVSDAMATTVDSTSAGGLIDEALSEDEMGAPAKRDSQHKSILEGVYDNLYDTHHIHQWPQFPGGETVMYQWIANHIIYPESAAKKGVKGRVIVCFIVECDGSITNIKVLRGKDPALDKEAIRVVSSMPKWNPGLLNDKPVRVEYLLPVTFSL